MHEIGQNYYYTLSHMTKAYRLQHDVDGSIDWYIVREQITKSLAIESNLTRVPRHVVLYIEVGIHNHQTHSGLEIGR